VYTLIYKIQKGTIRVYRYEKVEELFLERKNIEINEKNTENTLLLLHHINFFVYAKIAKLLIKRKNIEINEKMSTGKLLCIYIWHVNTGTMR